MKKEIASGDASPQVVDLAVVMKMFSKLQSQLNNLTSKMETRQDPENSEKVRQLESSQQSTNADVESLQIAMEEYKN